MADVKIQTLHPTLGKTNKKIDRDKYGLMRTEILSILKGRELTHNELFAALEQNLKGNFDGAIGWYGETVKLDLEARKIIERTTDKPQKYKIA